MKLLNNLKPRYHKIVTEKVVSNPQSQQFVQTRQNLNKHFSNFKFRIIFKYANIHRSVMKLLNYLKPHYHKIVTETVVSNRQSQQFVQTRQNLNKHFSNFKFRIIFIYVNIHRSVMKLLNYLKSRYHKIVTEKVVSNPQSQQFVQTRQNAKKHFLNFKYFV